RIVKAILKDGEVIEEFPTEVIDSRMIPKRVADEVTEMLIGVVEGVGLDGKPDGTGKRARSDMMKVAGKTGTADLINPKNGRYDGYGKMMSFCGFFPADNPQYTLLVQTIYEAHQDTRPAEEKKKLGGGSTSAVAFKEIADKIMAKRLRLDIEDMKEENPSLPAVKKGHIADTETVLKKIGMEYENDGKGEWGTISRSKDSGYRISSKDRNTQLVPDVTGMGAKDAVHLMQQCGLKVEIDGVGTVVSQSITGGSVARKGATVRLRLRH
ncbi:MAG: PASTA domain-containing protein, partial [Bacteroidaceae bacterium]|nr:PASTA domain-containing protein [Bacteroidaceae bacterium]